MIKNFTIHNNADEVIEERFESLLNRYQIELETSMSGSDLVFDCLHLLYYKCHKIKSNRVVSYIDSLDWIKNKKVTTNPINKRNNKYFQYNVTITSNHKNNWKKSWKNTKTFYR